MSSSTRTASTGGKRPLFKKRRTLAYEPVSTSALKVEIGSLLTSFTTLSFIAA